MKKMWNLTSSEADGKPEVNIAEFVNETAKISRTFVNITGIMNNTKIPND